MADCRDVSRELTDPRELRALAHPTRLAALEVLGRADVSLTATQIGERLDESASSMSYHLRQLAKYGFVEEADRDGAGRQRPWRLLQRNLSWSTSRKGAGEHDIAARELLFSFLERFIGRVSQWARDEPLLPQPWREVTGPTQTRIYVTAEELSELTVTLVQLVRRFDRPDPADRPSGAEAISLTIFPVPDGELRASGPADPR